LCWTGVGGSAGLYRLTQFTGCGVQEAIPVEILARGSCLSGQPGRGLLSGRGGRWSGAVFGADVGDQLGDFRVSDGVAEGGHLLAAVENLIGDFGRGPKLVFAEVDERRCFLGADAAYAVAMGTTFVAKQERAGLLVSFGFRCKETGSGERCKKDKNGQKNGEFAWRDHIKDFRIWMAGTPPPLGGVV